MIGRHLVGKPGSDGKFPATPGREARRYLKAALDRSGCTYETVCFSRPLCVPVAWQVQLQCSAKGRGWSTVPAAAAVGSPSCRNVEGPVTYVGSGLPMEYQLGSERHRGSVLLAALGAVPARQVIHTAREHGGLAALLYHPRASSVRAVAPDARLPLPAVTIGCEAASALAHLGGSARIDIESEERAVPFENIFVRRGEGPLHVVVLGHYDSRPLRLGPGARSLGLSVMLSLLGMPRPAGDRRLTFAFLDGEEVGSVGFSRYYEDLLADAVEPPDLVLDLNALGTRRELGIEVVPSNGDGAGLTELAVRAFQEAGLHLVSREVERRFYGGTMLPRVRWPVLKLGGRPRPRVPCWDPGEEIPDRWGVDRLAPPIAAILCEAGPSG